MAFQAVNVQDKHQVSDESRNIFFNRCRAKSPTSIFSLIQATFATAKRIV